MHQDTFEEFTDAVEDAREEWDRGINERLRDMMGRHGDVLDEPVV